MANSAERIAVIDLAAELQLRKQTIFKVLKRLGIRAQPRREEERGNQLIATISQDDAAAIRADLRRPSPPVSREAPDLSAFTGEEVGLFYVIQLEPNNDQGRFKSRLHNGSQ
ncbi:MAG TPA: hypothetical protein VLQ90_02830 [Pyrinomonadaceae bacterium]|nr:hypothetical protein [Pyrinomonadaceae bacterium]